MKLTFLGATGTVTGSKYLLETSDKKILIDCGLFQGLKELRLRNWRDLPIAPSELDAILLTHAHLDHSGYIPKLIKDGFTGTVYCSAATLDLCKILLPDSGYIQEVDAERANRYGYSKHHPALPLYTKSEAVIALNQFKAIGFGDTYSIGSDIHFSFHRAGHILGASFVRIADATTAILFSGDIGRLNDPVMKAPAKIQQADYIVLESTYGDKLHDIADPAEEFEAVINKTIARGGSVIIPAFAVGRAQIILYYLHKLSAEQRLDNSVNIYLDSPMAINASELLGKYLSEHRLPKNLCADVCSVAEYTRTVDQSKAIYDDKEPKIIISASGMATGGRVLHHLEHYLGDPSNTILMVGYQASGTRGEKLVNGTEQIKIHGNSCGVAAEIIKLDSLSAHADYDEILTWLENFTSTPKQVFLVHGESAAAASMQQKIIAKFGWDAVLPEYLEQFEL